MIHNIYRFLLPAACLAALASCGESKDDGPGRGSTDPNSVAITITTEVFTKADVTIEHKDGDAMNIYAKQYNSVEAADLVSGVKATMNAGKWTTSPEVRLSKGQVAFLYAVSPYDASYTNPKQIPVKLDKQVDLLYSGAAAPASFTSNTVKLTLRHALTLASFNIARQGYTGAGRVSQITIAGNRVFSDGTLDVATGKITGTAKNTVSQTFNATIPENGFEKDFPSMWLIPFSTQNASEADATSFDITIDGKSYHLQIPAADLNTGYQTIFHLVLTANSLQFIPSRTQQISLNQDTDTFEQPEGYGLVRFTVEGENWEQPLFLGSDVFGSILWDNDMATYDGKTALQFATGGTHTVSAETWNSTGFEINSMAGVSEIELADYE